jgi:hypothetical protein
MSENKKLKEFKDVWEACWDSHKQVGTKMKGGKEVPNCVPKNEDAPVNSVASGGVSMPPDAMMKKKKKDILTKLGRNIKENKDNNNAVMNSVLDQLDRLDVIVDELTYGKNEPEFVVDESKKSILEKARLTDSAFGSIGSGGAMGGMHPVAALGDTPPKGYGSRKIELAANKDPRHGIKQDKKTKNLKIVKREDNNEEE